MTFKPGDLVKRKGAETNDFWSCRPFTVKDVKLSAGSGPMEILHFKENEHWWFAVNFELVEPLKNKLEDFL